MTKIRPTMSAKYALKRAFDLYPIGRLAERLGVTDGYLYKCSDPDEDKEISCARALEIDSILRASGATSLPFLSLFRDNGSGIVAVDVNNQPGIHDSILASQANLGDLCRAVLKGIDRSSPQGERLSQRELQQIMVEIEDLESDLTKLKRAVIAAANE